MTPATVGELVDAGQILVCCGPGGVGKTTIAASMALEAARRGRRACVVTIDPARRLADALGLEALGNVPGRIAGDWPGELWGLMLDTKSTFDTLVTRYAASPEQAEGILQNRVYRNVSGVLSGTQEYMAMEKLYELHEQGTVGFGGEAVRFDVIVVDTPPTRNALDFVEAPGRLIRFLDNRLFRMLMTPTRAYLKAVSAATQAFLRTVSKVVSAEVVSDVVAFFQAFEGMEEGFRNRAQEVLDLLAADSTAFVLVTSAGRDAVEETAFFASKLSESGITTAALVVNRLHPRFGPSSSEALLPPDGDRATALAGTPLEPFYANLADFARVADREEAHFAALRALVAPAPVARVPFLPTDVHDIDGLNSVGEHLLAPPEPPPPSGRQRRGSDPIP